MVLLRAMIWSLRALFSRARGLSWPSKKQALFWYWLIFLRTLRLGRRMWWSVLGSWWSMVAFWRGGSSGVFFYWIRSDMD